MRKMNMCALVVVQRVVNPTKVWHVLGFCALALPANEVSKVQTTNKGMRKMNKCAFARPSLTETMKPKPAPPLLFQNVRPPHQKNG